MIRAVAIIAAMMFFGGCAAKPRVVEDPLGSTPEDFSLDLTVLTGDDVDDYPQAHLRQSRFVLMPDGTLHFGVDVDRTLGANWLPDVVRTLNRQQVAEVWSLARHLGLTDAARGDERVNFNLVKVQPDQIVYLAAFTGDDEAWAFIRKSTPVQPDAALMSLTRLLAQLSWATDIEEEAVAIMPMRYNFGPDPYARYRGGPTTLPGVSPGDSP